VTDTDLLQVIAGAIDTTDNLDFRPEITLSVKGRTIRGVLISARHFNAVHAEHFRSSDDPNDVAFTVMFERLQELAERQAATNADRLAPEMRFVGAPPDNSTYVHIVNSEDQGLWRVRLAEIDAWSLGVVEHWNLAATPPPSP
jgi:hypothetical protein